MDRDQFISMMMPYAMQASQQTGLDPRLIIAQSALETGWGRSAPGMNYFGIKSHGRSGGQSLPTTEVYNGQPVGIIDSFRTYSNPGESVSDYVNFLQTNPRYQPLLEAEGLDAQLAALGASGYATDPQYESKLRSIARGIEVGPMRDDDLIANAGAAINRAEAPQPSGLGRMSELFSTSSAPATSGGGGAIYSAGGLIPGIMLLSGKSGEGLSRDQRRMLGFAALADAGAALSGRQGGQTQAIAAQMQADQERERLRRQGLLQNLVAFEQALLPYRISGMEPPAGIMSAYNSALADFSAAGGMPAAAPAVTMPTPAAGVVPPAPVTEMPLGESAATDPIADLERRRDMAIAGGQPAMAQNFQAQIDALKEGELTAEMQRETMNTISDSGRLVSNYLIAYDDEGRPVINPMLTTRGGQMTAEALGSNEYKAFANAIVTIKENLAFEKLGQLKASGTRIGELTEGERMALSATAGSLDPTDPIGTIETLRRLQDQYDIDFGIPSEMAPPSADELLDMYSGG